jgi:multidrug efflux pump subunit AcrA (membrane-fusion protein)
MFTIVRGDVLELAASVPERLAAEVRPGQAVRLGVGGQTVDGTVARVSPTVDPATRALTAFVEVPNAGGALKGNTFATGRAIGRVVQNALVIPTAALRQTEAGTSANQGASETFVYRIRGGVADRAAVSLGVVDEAAGIAEVVDGLAEGDQIVVGNVGAVGRGTRVQVIGGGEGARAAAAAPAGAPAAAPAPARP